MLKNYFFSLLFLFVGFLTSANAQQSPILQAFNCKKEISLDEANKIVAEAQKGFSELRSMRADFYQDSFMLALDESEMSAGKVRLLKPGRMRWDYNTPEEQIFIVKEKDIWLYQPRLSQVMIDTLDKVLISQLPTAFLMGVGDLKKDFSVKSGCSTKDATLLNLMPASDSSESGSLSEFMLLLDSQTYLPKGAKITDLAGNQTAIIFKSIVLNDKAITDADFTYKFPENLDIDDRRKGTS